MRLCDRAMLIRRLAAVAVIGILFGPVRTFAALEQVPACSPVTERVALLRSILAVDWLTIRPEQVRKAWYRPLETVPTACHSQWGCLFIGTATNLPGPGTEPSPGDCSESFVFNPEVKNGTHLLTGVALSHWFRSLAEAQHAAEVFAGAIDPPAATCEFVSNGWAARERGRECQWAADGEKVIVWSVRLIHRGGVWGAELNVSRLEF